MHEPVSVVGKWLKRVVEGYYRYHAVPETSGCWDDFGTVSAGCGGTFYVNAASGGGRDGTGYARSLTDGYRGPVSCIPTRTCALTLPIQGSSRMR